LWRVSQNVLHTMDIKFVFDRRKKSSEKEKGLIELLLYFARNEKKYMTTGIEVYPEQWDGHVVNRKDSNKLNLELSRIKKKYEKLVCDMEVDGIAINIENFKEYIAPKEEIPNNFLNFMYEEIHNSTIRDTTKRQQYVAYEELKKFGKIKSFTSLNIRNIELFDTYLRRDNRQQSTIFDYHKRIKPYVNKAYRLGYISENPYLRFKNDRGKYKERVALTQEELDQLLSMSFDNKLSRVADLFIFQCYTGLSYADTQLFKYETEVITSNGMCWIDGKRYKTGTEFYTPILPPAMKVLEKYNHKVPHISNEKYNDYLHVIEAKMKLKKPLTSHVARHTFATTVALAHDVPIEDVSKMLGHKDIKTTQIYAKVLKSTIERNVIQKML